MPIAQVVDHVAQAQARLIQQYKDKPGITGLVGVLAARAQVIENALWSVLTQRSVANAVGLQLDNIGKIVNLPRASVVGSSNDETYRRWLGGQILALMSNGTTPDIDAVMNYIAEPGSSVKVLEQLPASIVVRALGAAQVQPAAMSQVLQLARSAGVRALLEYSLSTPPNTFTLDIGPGLDVGHLADVLPLG